MPSLSAKIINTFLKIVSPNKRLDFTKPPRNGKFQFPEYSKKGLKLTSETVQGKKIITMTPEKESVKQHIVYFHGGGYSQEIGVGHWFFFVRFIKKINCRISALDYPLAPENSFRETLSMALGSWQKLSEDYPKDDLILMGDSAGGGLILAMAQIISKDAAGRQPKACICLSPWLDLSMENPDMLSLEKSDHILTIQSLKDVAILYAHGEDLKDPRLSPLYGDFTSCAKTLIFYSDSELLGADCKKLESMMKSAGPEMKFIKYHNLPHDWPLFTFSEAESVLKEIQIFLDAVKRSDQVE